MEARLALFEEIRALYLACEEVVNVELYGSLAGEGFDRFADIDVCVELADGDSAAFMWKAIELFEGKFPTHFHDWAGSLLPDEYVVSFYLKDAPIYWNIDLKCTAAPDGMVLARADLDNDDVAHRLKPWAITCKYLMRGSVGAEHVRNLAARVLPEQALDGASTLELMERMLDELERRAAGRYKEFFADCRRTHIEDLSTLD